MLCTYDPEIFEVFVDDAEDATERVVTAADIAAVDAQIKAAGSGGAYADALARHDDETGTPTDPLLRKQTEGTMKDDAGQMVDRVLKHFDDALRMHCDAINKRMDAMEAEYRKDRGKRGKDSHFDEGEETEEERELARKREKGDGDLHLRHEGKDEDEPVEERTEKEKAREVVAHADAESVSDAIAMWRSRVDGLIGGLGQETPKSLSGEGVRPYQERVLRSLRKHSERFKNVTLSQLPAPAFAAVMDQILADAAEAAKRGPAVDGDQIIELKRRDNTGRMISTFHSNGRTFIRDMKRPARFVKTFFPHGGSVTAAS
jgi:hypothetical protein